MYGVVSGCDTSSAGYEADDWASVAGDESGGVGVWYVGDAVGASVYGNSKV